MLAAAFAPVLLLSNLDALGECPYRRGAGPPLGFLDHGGERNEGRLLVHDRSLLPEGNLVEDPFPQTAEPTVEGRVVRREISLGGRRGPAEALAMAEIRGAHPLHAPQGVLLVREDIGRENPPAVVTAGTATGERDIQDHPLSCRGDERAGDQRRGQVEGFRRPAAQASQAIEPGLDDGELLAIDGALKLGMVER